ncbi:MAG: hypothetical protein H6736_00555 [Alphaproteobacteria bacterium]|nr:hypothetical protein [Alphaproteobacteria bacterium]
MRHLPLIALLLPSPAWAWPYTPWTGATGAGIVAVNPYLSVQDGVASVNPWVVTGLTDHFEIIAGAWVDVDRNGDRVSSGVSLLPRFVVSDAFIVAPGLDLGDGAAVGSLQIHGLFEGERFMLSHNTGARAGADGTLEAFAIVAPEVVVSQHLWLFTEVNPTVDLTAGAVVADVIPGITVGLDDDANHLLTFVVPVSVGDGTSVGVGACYWGAFDTRTH